MIFAALALRGLVMKKVEVEWEDLPPPSQPDPIIGSQPKEESRSIVGMAGATMHHEHTNIEASSESGTTFIR
jgi:hypothetical protein